MSKESAIRPNQGGLIDHLIAKNRLKNDAELARGLKVAPPVISKIRHLKLPVGPTMILNIHETYGMPIGDIRKTLAA